ncbi:molybdopterin dinucleotide-binding protein [Methanospirillum sp. J.3.6.1-F.2.7.3]|jgi:formylmethanofuran dehydrogenase subunit D|uniref:Molybdopterin dinucleotide-binding protein n=2 Tax=Methanospirillum TaxID=2202 RepID=A0A8E7B2H4_9EURY|nr:MULTISPECIES: molybdopterin dinucleotide binding domain-containing protein [Methanospirillum]MDX8551434.1 molybdopterin dinucleotide binding domain-containing protein [Methanospirillum hungatei]NLW75256.1 molybdopterin dinucleotide-binding protein [Methanomicrobiales archaeon]QVV89891.1 molybdopterin dinucleotide-binding protein [Methanospirillum sp. J.3.6.1-F.2.7.3]QXO94297.1 molybdopterin dinucleotide-binding protein [Methanospirillum hungatei]
MTAKKTLNMITQRAIEEGIAMEIGKTSRQYFDACSIIEMNIQDMKELGIMKNTNVRVKSESGEVVVKAVAGRQTCYPGLCHIRQGVWANQVVPPRTQSTGAPQYSGFPVTVEPAPDEKLKSALELVQGSFGLWKGDQ